MHITWEKWNAAFLLYVGIIAEDNQDMITALFNYMGIIRCVYTTFGVMAWFKYDEQCRLRPAMQIGIWWDISHHTPLLEQMISQGSSFHTDSGLVIPLQAHQRPEADNNI